MLTAERAALAVFRTYLVEPGEMLCFHGQNLEDHRESLRQLTEQGLLSKESFKGSYSLTRAGFAAMQDCHVN